MNVKDILLIAILVFSPSLFCSIAPKAAATLPATLSFSAKEQSTPCANQDHTECYFTTPAEITKNPIKACLWTALVAYLTQVAIEAGTVPCSRSGCTNTSAVLKQTIPKNVVGLLAPKATRAVIFS